MEIPAEVANPQAIRSTVGAPADVPDVVVSWLRDWEVPGGAGYGSYGRYAGEPEADACALPPSAIIGKIVLPGQSFGR